MNDRKIARAELPEVFEPFFFTPKFERAVESGGEGI
jgi:hypothetical protein